MGGGGKKWGGGVVVGTGGSDGQRAMKPTFRESGRPTMGTGFMAKPTGHQGN